MFRDPLYDDAILPDLSYYKNTILILKLSKVELIKSGNVNKQV